MSDEKIKNSIMKSLLTNSTHNGDHRKRYQPYNSNSSSSETDESGAVKLNGYIQQSSKKEAGKVCPFQLDHSYCKPSNWRPENLFVKPVQNLFFPQKDDLEKECDEEIDVTKYESSWKPFYDVGKARILMDECKKHISLVRVDEGDPYWDLKVDRSSWTVAQNRLFERTCRILNVDRLGRLAISHHPNEPILRRIQVNKSARRLRTLLSAVYWDSKLTHWLHNTLLDTLEKNYLVAYVDILQTLKSKIPNLIERLLQAGPSEAANSDALNVLLQRPWDPSSLTLSSFSLRKLPGNPVLLLVPGTPGNKPRPNRWLPYLSRLGTLLSVPTGSALPQGSNKVTLLNSLEHMLSATRLKVAELKKEHPSKQVILVGINNGSALACQVALIDSVSCVVCLGFPLRTVEGPRGLPDDNLLSLQVPVLFVIGQNASTSTIDELEDTRERMLCETGLVVVGGADDHLRIPKSMQQMEGVTQHIVDRCIIEEVGDFLGQLGGRNEDMIRARMAERKRKLSDIDGCQYSTLQGSTLPTTTQKRGGRRPRGGVNRSSVRGISGRWSCTRQVVTSSTTHIPSTSYTQMRSRLSSMDLGGKQVESAQPTATTFLVSDILQQVDESSPSDGTISQIKILGSEGSQQVGALQGKELVEQLTPDRLLEMPIIIAHDEDPSESSATHTQFLVRGGITSDGRTKLKMGQARLTASTITGNHLKCAKIILKKKDTSSAGSFISVDLSEQLKKKQIYPSELKTRICHIPATRTTTTCIPETK